MTDSEFKTIRAWAESEEGKTSIQAVFDWARKKSKELRRAERVDFRREHRRITR